MGAYRLLIKASAAKEIEAVRIKADRKRIVGRMQAFAGDPRQAGSEKLAGSTNRYRDRQGQYRIIYLIDDGPHGVSIFKVDHRKDVYR